MSRKNHLSLLSEILIGMIGSVVIITLFLGLSFSFVVQNIVKIYSKHNKPGYEYPG